MKKIIVVVFPDIDDKNIRIELDESLSPKTFQAIIDHLPIKVKINKCGDELYTDPTPIYVEKDDDAKTEVNELDVAYWPQGRAICLFYGPTPISKNEKILAYSPVNIVGKIIDYSKKFDILNQIKVKTNVIIKQSER
ncbi:MAG TPA: cyclophilin-like fold protein [Candidatus Nitrosocosmicus sp.]|nr:cyclophilin-like fold protein [Candidatus Nitrosocosmicus sp.]